MSTSTLPAAHPTLGERRLHARRVVEAGSGRRFVGGALLVVGVLLVLGMAAAGAALGLAGAAQGDAAAGLISATASTCVGVAAGILPVVIGALLLRSGRSVPPHVEEVGVYTSGVLSKRGDETTILHWGEVLAFKRSPAKGRISVVSTDLPMLFFRLEATQGRHIEVRGFPELPTLGEAVEAETTRRRIRDAQEAVDRGERVAFGGVAITPEGVTGFGLGGGLLRWDEVEGFGLARHHTFAVKQRLNPILLKGPLFVDMPDAAAFVHVVSTMRGRHAGAGGRG